MTKKPFNWAAGLALCFLAATPVWAAERQLLHGHVPGTVTQLNLHPVGRLPATDRLYLAIGLPLRDQAAFSNELAQLYDPTNPQFHHWLTPKQIAQQFGPSEQDYEAVIAWATANGLTIAGAHADHLLLRVQGSVADIEKMLHVTIEVYKDPAEDRTFYGPDVEPSIDLPVPLLHITGLYNFITPPPRRIKQTPPTIPSDAISQGSGPSNTFWGNDFRAAYVPNTSLTGSGQVLGLLAQDDYYPNDIAAYIKSSGISTSVVLTRVPVDGGVSGPSTNNDEVSLDIEMAIAMAPGLSQLLIYEAPRNGTDYVDILKQMQEDDLAQELSSSVIAQEADPGLDANADVYYQLMAGQGQSYFQASGDYGPYYPGVAQWADDPYITIVGGTILNTSSPGGSWAVEAAWQNSGGGISANYLGNYTIPSYQQGVSTNLSGGSTTMRNVPDVAMIADNIYLAYNNGAILAAAGTSAATPLWAGYTALVNQQAAAIGQPTVGFLNPAIYAIGQGANYDNCFHDTTLGQAVNFQNGQPVNNKAVVGYDLATGWGTPNGANLINALITLTGAVWVDFNYTGTTQNGSFASPFKTLAAGVSAVPSGGNLWIKTAGSSSETLTITKPMIIRANDGSATIGQ